MYRLNDKGKARNLYVGESCLGLHVSSPSPTQDFVQGKLLCGSGAFQGTSWVSTRVNATVSQIFNDSVVNGLTKLSGEFVAS